MKNTNQFGTNELSTNELISITGGNWFSDLVDTVETAIVWYENIKKYVPSL